MTDFALDGDKRFSENFADFLKSVEDIDPKMAEILEANKEELLSVVSMGERDTRARTTFNEAIACALDNLLAKETDEERE